ncbi:MAG: hypothetical protein LBC02_11005 [Planctomycetaceae bacterium]|jgi:hypothetical protein|nr:hypothetical protein [Planctomycetaceae bacterium]
MKRYTIIFASIILGFACFAISGCGNSKGSMENAANNLLEAANELTTKSLSFENASDPKDLTPFINEFKSKAQSLNSSSFPDDFKTAFNVFVEATIAHHEAVVAQKNGADTQQRMEAYGKRMELGRVSMQKMQDFCAACRKHELNVPLAQLF